MTAAVNLGPYFDQISSRRDEPIAGHSCMQMSPLLASREVSFRVVSLQIPDYELSDTDLIHMPSCLAVRMKYERAGEMCQVFQFPRGQAVDLGTGPMLTTVVNDRPVRIVQSGEVFGAAWETGESTISVVGPRDLSKFMQMVAQVDSQFREMRQ